MDQPAGRVAFFADLRYDPKYKMADYFPPDNLDVEAVLLGGDIEYRPEPLVQLVKEFQAKQRPGTLIVHVPGNEEHAGHDIQQSKKDYAALVATVPNAVYLDDEVLLLPSGIRIIGTTLWEFLQDDKIDEFVAAIEKIPGVEKRPDGERQREWRETNQLFLECRDFVERELRKLTPEERERTIVVSHHWPTQLPWMNANGTYSVDDYGINPEWFTGGTEQIEAILEDVGPKYWLCGHAHETKEVRIGNTTVRSNPYVGSKLGETNPDFDPHFVIEL